MMEFSKKSGLTDSPFAHGEAVDQSQLSLPTTASEWDEIARHRDIRFGRSNLVKSFLLPLFHEILNTLNKRASRATRALHPDSNSSDRFELPL